MIKLNLVIADTDEAYARSLAAYLNSYQLSVFSISCFTKQDAFVSFMSQKPAVDVLLAGPEFYEISADCTNIVLKLMLWAGTADGDYQGIHKISRFSTGERLAGEIIHLYSGLNASDSGFSSCIKDTGFVAVYSPTGGTGKTTIAAALAMHCSELGMKPLYLNMESIGSTAMYFTGDSRRNLSYVFYYLKERSDNLPMRIEGIRSTDSDTGVDFFYPPENPMEYGELEPEDMEHLFRGIRDMNCYDYVFVDMSCSFDENNLKVMSLCECIVLTELPEAVSRVKKQMLLKELERQDPDNTSAFSRKLVNVVNRQRNMLGDTGSNPVEYSDEVVRIPEYSRALIKENGCISIDDESFWIAVNRLSRLISHMRGSTNG